MITTELLLEKGATYRKALPGDIIFSQGSPATYYYQLVSGRVKWCYIDEDGKEILHKIVEDGESFGYLPLMDDEPYAASAIADTPCTMLRLCASSFHQLLKENSDIHFAFTKSLAEHLRFKFLLTNLLANSKPEEVITKL
ncbi:Crp/Fnr family transcriptional regulator, partial [Pseudoxanthomonas sp. SGD-10]